MEIAMATPHQPPPRTLRQQCPKRRQTILTGGIQLIDSSPVNSLYGTEFCCVSLDDSRNGSEPGFAVRARRFFVRLQDRLCNVDGKRWRDILRLGDSIKRLLLIEARHFDGPFDRRAASAYV